MLVTTLAPRIWSSLRSCSLLVPLLIVWDPGSMFNVNNSLEMQTEHIEIHCACGCSFFLQLSSADEPEEEMQRTGFRRCPDVPSHSGTVQVTLLPVIVCDSIHAILTSREVYHSAVLGVQDFCLGWVPKHSVVDLVFQGFQRSTCYQWPNAPTNRIVRIDNGTVENPRQRHSYWS